MATDLEPEHRGIVNVESLRFRAAKANVIATPAVPFFQNILGNASSFNKVEVDKFRGAVALKEKVDEISTTYGRAPGKGGIENLSIGGGLQINPKVIGHNKLEQPTIKKEVVPISQVPSITRTLNSNRSNPNLS